MPILYILFSFVLHCPTDPWVLVLLTFLDIPNKDLARIEGTARNHQILIDELRPYIKTWFKVWVVKDPWRLGIKFRHVENDHLVVWSYHCKAVGLFMKSHRCSASHFATFIPFTQMLRWVYRANQTNRRRFLVCYRIQLRVHLVEVHPKIKKWQFVGGWVRHNKVIAVVQATDSRHWGFLQLQ